jgi:hypothetical protein
MDEMGYENRCGLWVNPLFAEGGEDLHLPGRGKESTNPQGGFSFSSAEWIREMGNKQATPGAKGGRREMEGQETPG